MDHNATSVVDKEVKKYFSSNYGNPSSLHAEGQAARQIVEKARDNIRDALNAANTELVFTASGTEANNMVFQSFPDHAHLISAIEHPSVLYAANNPIIIPVDAQGLIKLDRLSSVLRSLNGKKFLVSIMLANNETGVLQPISRAAQLVKENGGVIHTDAAQGCGKIPVDMNALGVDMMTVSAHKCGGLVGVGGLLFKKNIDVRPLILGGGQEKKLRAGTENVPAIAAFDCVMCKLPMLIEKMQEVELMRNYLEQRIYEVCPEVKIFSANCSRLPNTSCLVMPGVKSDVQVMTFDLNGIALGRGAACSSGLLEGGSHVLKAMGVSDKERAESIRVSLGWDNSQRDIDKFVKVWKMMYNKRQC